MHMCICFVFSLFFDVCNLKGIPRNQDKGLSQDFPVILAAFSLDSVAEKQRHIPWRFIFCSYLTARLK